MENELQIKISINKDLSFVEEYREGFVEYNGEEHKFWIVYPKGVDPNGNEYEIDVKWFFQRVPREIRAMNYQIIEAFKQIL